MVLRVRFPEIIARFDAAVDQAFAPARTIGGLNRLAYVASEAADNSKLWHGIGLTMAIVRPDLRPRALRMAITLGVESAVVNGMMKPLIKRDRPTGWEVDSHQVRRPKTASFPSGHASSGAVAATMLSDALPAGRALWWSLAAVVAASRVHTRMHHASDVVAGAVIGRVIGQAAVTKVPLTLPILQSVLPAGDR